MEVVSTESCQFRFETVHFLKKNTSGIQKAMEPICGEAQKPGMDQAIACVMHK